MVIYGGKATLKELFLHNRNWWRFYNKYKDKLRDDIITAVTKMLSCRNTNLRGYWKYECPKCGHAHLIRESCKSKFCSSCGKKATETWIMKAYKTFPPVPFHHITFTMPSQLWEIFWLNRDLFGRIMKAAGDTLNEWAYQSDKIKIPIYLGLHTFGSALPKNVHIHSSAATVGITDDLKTLKEISFDRENLMKMWRYRIITIFRQAAKNHELNFPQKLKHLNNYLTFNSWLNVLYQKHWIVDVSKKHQDHSITTKYIGKYIKRPAIGDARIISFNDNQVKYKFKDHHTNSTATKVTTIDEFIALVIQHIPDKNFRMIRYYGALANRVRGKLLAKIFELLGVTQQDNNVSISYRQLMMQTFRCDPLVCPICNIDMQLVEAKDSKQNVIIMQEHDRLSQSLI